MEFVAGKGLRVTGLIEFIVLCLHLAPRVSYSSSDHESPEHSVVDIAFSLIGFGLMFPVLYFLRVDTRPCNDKTITLAFWLTVAVFICACVHKFISKVRECLPLAVERDDDIDPAELQYLEQKESLLISCMRSFWDRLSKMPRMFKILGFAGLIVFFLFIVALGMFFFITIFKLAIPGTYATPCEVTNSTSRVLLLAIPYTSLVVAALRIIYECIACFSKLFWSRMDLFREDSANRRRFVFGVATVTAILVFIANTTLGVFVYILTCRVARIWRGHDVDLYEFFALTAALPALL